MKGEATVGFDIKYDLPKLLDPPLRNQYVKIYFKHPDWLSGLTLYFAYDIKSYDTLSWRFYALDKLNSISNLTLK